MEISSRFRSRIATRISLKLLCIYIIIYVVILLALFLILAPQLYKSSMKRGEQMQSIFTSEYEALQTQLSEGLNSLSSSFFQEVAAYEKNPTPAGKARITLELSTYTASHQLYSTVGLHLPSGEYISSFYYNNLEQEKLLSENSHYQNLLSSKTSSYFSPFYKNVLITETNAETTNTDDLIYFSKAFLHGTQSYTLTLFYNASALLEKNNLLNSTFFDSYTILDKYDDTIYTTDNSLPQELLKSPETFTQSSGYFSFRQGLCFYERIPATGWVVISYVSYFHFLEDLFQIMGIVTALYLLSPILYCAFLIPLTRRQLLPIKTLSDTMSTFQAGHEISCKIHTQDEIEDLSNTFNKMVREINQQVNDIRTREHENSVINYKLLATQIDPHFIYNTMNIINIMARRGKTAEIIELNTALTRILRERLNSKLSIYDTIQNEYETLLQYETIMDYRYEHQIIIHYDIDEALMDKKIPKNILQPLIENSFYHGFGNEVSSVSGNIDIMIYSIDKEIVIEVSDNGQGMSQERLIEIKNQSYSIYTDKKPHIGLNNIQQRLQFIYGDSQTLEIHSTLGIGTTIIITIPIQLPEIFLQEM